MDPILGGEPNVTVTPLAGIMIGELYLKARHAAGERIDPPAP